MNAVGLRARADALLTRLAAVVAANLPDDIEPDYFDGFLARNRDSLVGMLAGWLEKRQGRPATVTSTDLVRPPPDLWTAAERTAANLAAMKLAANKAPAAMTPDDRATLAGYSGWGGLSITKVASQFPQGFPVPEERGLIHEYYTPTVVAREVARVVRPLLAGLPDHEGRIRALEPSAGIGRFLLAAAGPGWEGVDWTAVEWSDLSSRMLQATRPDATIFAGPFERWVAEHGEEHAGTVGLLIANPPYGARGASITEDPDRAYREKKAYAYFLRRALDLLAPGGLGVFLVPSGFLTGRSTELTALREKVLLRHHLAAAYRLPSGIFPGATLVTDLLFFRARPGTLAEVDPGDHEILNGGYFKAHPGHILGREIGAGSDDDDQTKKPRWGYQVEGTFERLPDLVERPICASCAVLTPVRRAGPRDPGRKAVETQSVGLDAALAAAVALGLRVERYLALTADGTSREPVLLWSELTTALRDWTATHGNPWRHTELRKLAHGGAVPLADRFLQAFTKSGDLIPGLSAQPTTTPRYTGRPDDVVALAETYHRAERTLTIPRLVEVVTDLWAGLDHKPAGLPLDLVLRKLPDLFAAGWCLDGDAWTELVPGPVYLSGDLWPRYDRCVGKAPRTVPLGRRTWLAPAEQIEAQRRRLHETIKPAVFEEIDGVSPQQGWVPLRLVQDWINRATTQGSARLGTVQLERRDGLLQVAGVAYDELGEAGSVGSEVQWILGWINHDRTLFNPKPDKQRRATANPDDKESVDKRRLEKAKEWNESFHRWVASDAGRREAVEHAYNRQFRGYLAPEFGAEPLEIGRWTRSGVVLKPHQVAGARRVLANRGGLLAFDVGVGKTYTGLGILAAARQDGWARRPVIVVPNSIVWKWAADIARTLPDYRVAVIGSKLKTISRGPRKGFATSETDTPEERGQKWTRFQAGEYDVVLLTYTALARTKMNESAIRAYAGRTPAIQREVALQTRNASEKKNPTERQMAVLKEGMAAWVAQQMELPEGWSYDAGVTWDQIGVDFLMVDEAQNFKNLYLPEAREGGVPRFMGNAGEGSKRAWQLDFRAASVRARTGGAGVILLSATPAKNSPLELYSLIQMVDGEAFARLGITDPEQFIDRYLKLEMRQVVDSKMEVVDRSAVVGFQNLHELRDVIFRYAEFKTADEVGLVLPEPKVEMVEVDMNTAQEAKYEHYVRQIEAAMDSDNPADKGKILGLLARMALVAVHDRLDEGFDWKSAGANGIDPTSPKFDAMAERVLRNPNCGHIIFLDNVAGHRWVQRTLVDAGIPEHRIAVLNAETAKAAADRQRIAQEFNGDPDEGIAPKYDVVIANAVAYEGIDLQTRTCAIHHLDLPWEPATLQQRNGRGVRQGNRLGQIDVYYYFARRSQDGLRFNLIQGKRGWMVALIKSQDRATNNPGAQMDLGPEEILLLISRNPEVTRRRIAEVKAKREAELRAEAAKNAARVLRAANARFRMAEKKADPTEAADARADGEAKLHELSQVDPTAWPWVEVAWKAREHRMVVPEDGSCPVYEGMRVVVPDTLDASVLRPIEFGRVSEDTTTVTYRAAGDWRCKSLDVAQLGRLRLTPDHLRATWPADDTESSVRALVAQLPTELRNTYRWSGLGLRHAADGWLTEVWPTLGPLLQAGAKFIHVPVPIMVDGRLGSATGVWDGGIRGGTLLPPTRDGWHTFLRLAPASGLKFGDLEAIGSDWWDRKIPRNLLSAGREP